MEGKKKGTGLIKKRPVLIEKKVLDYSLNYRLKALNPDYWSIRADILSDISSHILPVEVRQCPLRSGSRG